LVEFGIDPRNISARGYGETRPLATNGTAAGRLANRRVEILISGDSLGAPDYTRATLSSRSQP
jgi:flagellar motor protein MotB